MMNPRGKWAVTRFEISIGMFCVCVVFLLCFYGLLFSTFKIPALNLLEVQYAIAIAAFRVTHDKADPRPHPRYSCLPLQVGGSSANVGDKALSVFFLSNLQEQVGPPPPKKGGPYCIFLIL